MTLKSGSKIIETDRYRSMGLFRTVSEINSDFSRNRKFSHSPYIFCAPAEGIPWELSIGARGQKN